MSFNLVAEGCQEERLRITPEPQKDDCEPLHRPSNEDREGAPCKYDSLYLLRLFDFRLCEVSGASATGHENKISENCHDWETLEPPNIIELGNAGWTLLHCVAAYYSEEPTEEERVKTQRFYESFLDVFPCKYCKTHAKKLIENLPLALDTRVKLEQWTCELHNLVNEKLGKPMFDPAHFNHRWRLALPPWADEKQPE